MENNLTPDEISLLQQVNDNQDLQPLFFSKVKGVKWYDAIESSGYFNVEKQPKPHIDNESGFINIYKWDVLDYLIKTAPELSEEDNLLYASKTSALIVNTTNYAKENEFSNYRTWWQLSKILPFIPNDYVSDELFDCIRFWLYDKYDKHMVFDEIAKHWISRLLDQDDQLSHVLILKLVSILYQIDYQDYLSGIGEKSKIKKAVFLADNFHVNKHTKKISYMLGEKIGIDAVELFVGELKKLLDTLDNDTWSASWQPAIQDHDQNQYHKNAENILILATRDCLHGYIDKNRSESLAYMTKLIGSSYETIKRIAIYFCGKYYEDFNSLTDKIIDGKQFSSNFQHEIWHYLNLNYKNFKAEQKYKVIKIISNIKHINSDGYKELKATAFRQTNWLDSIKNYGEDEMTLYQKSLEISGVVSEHPDFSHYMFTGFAGTKSPIPIEKLQSLDIHELIDVLNSYEDKDGRLGEGIEGLVKGFNDLIKSNPEKYYLHLDNLLKLDIPFIHELIDAYKSLWVGEVVLPWDDIWEKLLNFCLCLIEDQDFWLPDNNDKNNFIANKSWVASIISDLVQVGTKSDENAFDMRHIETAEKIVLILLDKVEHAEFTENEEAVSVSLNSSRGRAIEALINLTLRVGRSEDKSHGNHKSAWTHFEPIFSKELESALKKESGSEFITLIAMMIPNLIYLSPDWVKDNLSKIFYQNNYNVWICAIQGYIYVNEMYDFIFEHLKNNGDILKALDLEILSDRGSRKLIQNICLAYINDQDLVSDDNSLITITLNRKKYEELSELIWFMWTLRGMDDCDIDAKVFELWPEILNRLNLNDVEDRKIASKLCLWSSFVKQIDNTNFALLKKVALYANEDYNSDELIETISRVSKDFPQEAYEIWKILLEANLADYPEDEIRIGLSNLLSAEDGLTMARDIVSEYLKYGMTRPTEWLQEIRDS